MKAFFVTLMVVGLWSAALAQEGARPTAATQEGDKAPLMVSFTDLKWTELPERKGMQFAVLSGDPKKGEYTQMRKVPAGTDNPLHAHSSELKNVIISGIWYTGTNAASARDFGPGSIVMMPANWVHVSGCRSGSDCVFYQDGKGKFDFKPVEEPWPLGDDGASALNRVFGGGRNNSSRQPGVTEGNRRNHGDDACCAGLSPEGAL